MPNYIIYDPASSPIANRVTRFLPSFDQGREGELGANFLRDPDLSGVDTGQRMLVDAGAVRNLTAQETQTEDDALAAAQLAARRQAVKDKIRDAQDEQRLFTIAIAKILKQYVDYRAAGNPVKTLGELNTELQNEIDAQADNLS